SPSSSAGWRSSWASSAACRGPAAVATSSPHPSVQRSARFRSSPSLSGDGSARSTSDSPTRVRGLAPRRRRRKALPARRGATYRRSMTEPVLRDAKRPASPLAGPYGHPFHAMLVTIPIGTWVAGVVFDIVGLAGDDPAAFATGARWLFGF